MGKTFLRLLAVINIVAGTALVLLLVSHKHLVGYTIRHITDYLDEYGKTNSDNVGVFLNFIAVDASDTVKIVLLGSVLFGFNAAVLWGNSTRPR
jgi:hypothetical protein